MKIEISLKEELKSLVDFRIQCGLAEFKCNSSLKFEDDCISVVKCLERFDERRRRDSVVLCKIPYPDGYKEIFENPVQDNAVIDFKLPKSKKLRKGMESILVEGGKDVCFIENLQRQLDSEFSFKIHNAQMHIVFKPEEFNKEGRRYTLCTLKPKEYSRIIAHVMKPERAFSIILTLPVMCLR